MLRAVVEVEPFLRVLAARLELAAEHETRSERAMGQHQRHAITALLRLRQKLTPQVSRNGDLAGDHVKVPEPQHRLEDLCIIASALTQLARARVGLSHLRVGVTARRHEWRAQRQQQTKFIMIPRCRFRLEQEQSQRATKVRLGVAHG